MSDSDFEQEIKEFQNTAIKAPRQRKDDIDRIDQDEGHSTLTTITERLAEIRSTSTVLDTLAFDEPVIEVDYNDDLAREASFYKQAMASVEQCRDLFKKESIPFTRPADYFAEMVKSDSFMSKIRQNLISDLEGVKASERAKKQRELKKFGKKVQVEKINQRLETKKNELAQIKKTFKNKDEPQSASRDSNNKRTQKNSKYGFGGQKRHSKSNTSASTDEMGGFSIKKFKGGNSKGGKGSVGKKQKRPNPAARKAGKR